MFGNIPEGVIECMEKLKSYGYPAYLVGGCVRDELMGIPPHDYDLTTGASPEKMLDCFKGYRVIPTGLKHGTLTVISHGYQVEITAFRIDGAYEDNRHPSFVNFTEDLSEDLSRRDFTVNAMAYNPDSGIVDMFGGREHIKQKLISCVGDPDTRFGEDGLRIMRALRFSSVLGFDIDAPTAESLHKNRKLLENIAVERILTEFEKMITGWGAADIIGNYSDVISVFIPEIRQSAGISEAADIIKILNNSHADAQTCIAALLFACGVDSNGAKEIMKRLKSDRDSMVTVSDLVRDCSAVIPAERASIRLFLKNKTREYAYRLAALRLAITKATAHEREAAESFISGEITLAYESRACLSLAGLEINGGDLAAIDVPRGKQMGDILSALLDSVITGKLPNQKEILLENAKNMNKNN